MLGAASSENCAVTVTPNGDAVSLATSTPVRGVGLLAVKSAAVSIPCGVLRAFGVGVNRFCDTVAAWCRLAAVGAG